MILEHGELNIRSGQEAAFQDAFETAKGLVASSPGCLSVELHRCVERPSTYLLLIAWESIEAHTEGFRGSERFEQWRALLHHFYDPAPRIEHFEAVTSA